MSPNPTIEANHRDQMRDRVRRIPKENKKGTEPPSLFRPARAVGTDRDVHLSLAHRLYNDTYNSRSNHPRLAILPIP